MRAKFSNTNKNKKKRFEEEEEKNPYKCGLWGPFTKEYLQPNGSLKLCPGCVRSTNISPNCITNKNGDEQFIWRCLDCTTSISAINTKATHWSLNSSIVKALKESSVGMNIYQYKKKISNLSSFSDVEEVEDDDKYDEEEELAQRQDIYEDYGPTPNRLSGKKRKRTPQENEEEEKEESQKAFADANFRTELVGSIMLLGHQQQEFFKDFLMQFKRIHNQIFQTMTTLVSMNQAIDKKQLMDDQSSSLPTAPIEHPPQDVITTQDLLEGCDDDDVQIRSEASLLTPKKKSTSVRKSNTKK